MATTVKTDPVIRGCLDKLRRCEITAAGVLADHLEESGHPLAAKVRAAWNFYNRRIAMIDGVSDAYWARKRAWTRWEARAFRARQLRRRISMLFNRNWRWVPLAKFRTAQA